MSPLEALAWVGVGFAVVVAIGVGALIALAVRDTFREARKPKTEYQVADVGKAMQNYREGRLN